jgi:hypothetical protein
LKIPNTKRTGGVVQGVGLKFKPQFRKKKKKKEKRKVSIKQKSWKSKPICSSISQ